MLTKKKLPLLILGILVVEILIYFWACWTSTLSEDNFFAIESEFIFNKCARNSGRVAAALNLMILLIVGYYGLKQIYTEDKKREQFRILITLFAVNHLIHFFFVFQTFEHHDMALKISENKHGFITFIFIQLIPIVLWSIKNLSVYLYSIIVLHLFNVSYFIMETFYNKITIDKPAYHNQFGIAITTVACVYVLYRFVRDFQAKSSPADVTER